MSGVGDQPERFLEGALEHHLARCAGSAPRVIEKPGRLVQQCVAATNKTQSLRARASLGLEAGDHRANADAGNLNACWREQWTQHTPEDCSRQRTCAAATARR